MSTNTQPTIVDRIKAALVDTIPWHGNLAINTKEALLAMGSYGTKYFLERPDEQYYSACYTTQQSLDELKPLNQLSLYIALCCNAKTTKKTVEKIIHQNILEIKKLLFLTFSIHTLRPNL